MGIDRFRIPVEKLRKVCDYEAELRFCNTSEDVKAYDGVIGQERADQAMNFGLGMSDPGYNIFVVGPQGTGKSTYTQAIVSRVAKKGKAPDDWCYINNFSNRDLPIAVSFPAGQGRIFQKDMDELVEELQVLIPEAFESSDYEQKEDTVEQHVQERIEDMFQAMEKEALDSAFSMKRIPPRVVFIPLKKDGMPMPQEEYASLPEDKRKEIDEKGRKLRKKLDETLREVQMLEKQARDQIAELERQVASFAAELQINKLKEKYNAYPKILEYLETVEKDIEENHELFRGSEAPIQQGPFMMYQEEVDPFIRYRVNLFVNNEKSEGAPVIFESNPYYYNIFGKIEYKSQILAVSTDFTMIKPGSLQQANGGYLILQAKDVLMDPFAWDALKKALKYKQAVVENIGEQYRLVPTVSLRPEPVPLNVKIILMGNPFLYEILYTMDEDFKKLFKVKVDFDVEMERTQENLCKYVSFVSTICREGNKKHFNRPALGQVVEYGSILSGNQNKLSTLFNEITEIVNEAAALAQEDGSEYVEARHVDKAIENQKGRANRVERKIQEQILLENIIIRTEGYEVGQINGLAVVGSAGYQFGLPSRITARTYAGNAGVINIERETEMSGTIHSKGVLTLAGYLGGKFAQKKPLGLTAQVTFEQNYGGVEGDSASSTELYAILSSLSELPLKQSLAVTGSVDQMGVIQPIGGVTEKIEGFYDVCKAKGLTGEQGVVIPVQNIDNLMLKDEIIQAVKENKFNVYAVKNIEEGIELLCGVPAGAPDKDGKYPEGTVFIKVEKKLMDYVKGLIPIQLMHGTKPSEPKGGINDENGTGINTDTTW
ncbi:MAG: Lon protease family protein [Clostridiaceae bacterium]